ncbi:hypothetical protein ACWCV9_30140 [Streptomyces sp. NPDC001606]
MRKGLDSGDRFEFPLIIPRRLSRAYGTLALRDEAYALATGERAPSWPGRRVMWVQVHLHVYWAGSGITGALLGSVIPDAATGPDFALFGAVTARLLFPDQRLLAAFALFTAALLARRLPA